MIFALAWAGLVTGAVAAADPVDAEAEALRRAAGNRRLIVLGEMHGTREVPRLAAALVEAYARDGQPVVLALELPRDGHAASRAYLASDGGHAARQALATHRFLQPPTPSHDGRRNASVVELYEALRQLRARGADVAIAPVDVVESTHGAAARDRAMAAQLRRVFEALPRGRVIAVVGNVHAMRVRPTGPDFPLGLQPPMAWYLRDLAPYTVNIGARSGAFPACTAPGQCRLQPVPGNDARSGPLRADDAWHYRLMLPRFTPADDLP